MLDPATKLGPAVGYDLEAMDDELVLYHAESESVFYCNATAALVYRLCDGERSVEQIVALVADAYPDAREQISVEVPSALLALVRHGALEAR